MSVYISNLVLHTGVDFEQIFELTNDDNTPLNLTGYTISSQIKKSRSSSSSVVFTCTFVNQPTSGNVRIELSSAQTTEIKPGIYQYDLILTSPQGIKTKAVEGEVFVKRSVTR